MPTSRLSIASVLLAFLIPHALGGDATNPDGTDARGGRPSPSVLPGGLEERVQVVLRQIDFLVVDKRGRPVTDLLKEEVHLWEDGEARPITHFTRPNERTPKPGPSQPASPPLAAVPAPPAPNPPATERPRWIVLFFDAGGSHLQTRIRAAAAAHEMLASALRPGDRVSVIVADDDLRIVVPFTRDHAMAARALEDGAGLSARSWDMTGILDSARADAAACQEQEDRQACVTRALQNFLTETSQQAKRTLRQMEALVRSLSTIPERKLVFYFSDSLLLNPGEVASSIAQYAIGQVGTRIPQLTTSLRRDFSGKMESILQLATRGRVGFYPVNGSGRISDAWLAPERRAEGGPGLTPQVTTDPYELAGKMSRDLQSRLAVATGGSTLFTRDPTGRLVPLLNTADGVYSIGYHPERSASKPVGIKIKVDRPQVKVLYLHSYRPLPSEAARRLGGDLKVDTASYDPLTGLVRAELALPSASFAVDSESAPPSSSVGIFIEVTDASGTPLQDHFEVVSLPRNSPRAASASDGTAFRRPFAVNVPPGAYQLRVEVQDVNGPGWGSFSTSFAVGAAESPARAAPGGSGTAPSAGSAPLAVEPGSGPP